MTKIIWLCIYEQVWKKYITIWYLKTSFKCSSTVRQVQWVTIEECFSAFDMIVLSFWVLDLFFEATLTYTTDQIFLSPRNFTLLFYMWVTYIQISLVSFCTWVCASSDFFLKVVSEIFIFFYLHHRFKSYSFFDFVSLLYS